jgi:DNA polymerase-3 subunit epsilon
MRYVVVDTETTGLIRQYNFRSDGTKFTARSDEPGQPRMAEFAAVIVDGNFNVLDGYQQYIAPNRWMHGAEVEPGVWADTHEMIEMPEEAYSVNKLSFAFLRENGRSVGEALRWYASMLALGCIPLGFNMQYDGRMLRGELRRAGMPDLFDETPNVCAMRSMQAAKIKVKKLNGKGGFPRLIDVAAHFGAPGYSEDKHHKAAEDVRATAYIAGELHKLDKLLPPAVYRSKHLEAGEVS